MVRDEVPQPIWILLAPVLRCTTLVFIDPGVSPRPSRAVGPWGKWALAGATVNIRNHSQAGAITLIPGLSRLVGLGWRWLSAVVKFPRSLSCHRETETGGKKCFFPRERSRKHTLCKQARQPAVRSTGLSASIRGMQLRTNTTHSSDGPPALIPPPVLPPSSGQAPSWCPPGTASVLACPQGERVIASCPAVGTL